MSKDKSEQEQIVIEREGGASSATSLALHPLVLINISDHYTRAKVNSGEEQRVVGVLVGTQNGRHVEIFNSFAMPMLQKTEKGWEADMEYARAKMVEFHKVFPTQDLVGWYSTGGNAPDSGDLQIQGQFTDLNENPLYLLLNPAEALPTKSELPISIYESEIKVIKNEPKTFFAKMRYRIETGESERISVDHIAHVVVNAEDDSSMSHSLSGTHNAIRMLAERIELIKKFLKETIDGKIPTDHDALRQIASLCNLLPAIDSAQFRDEFLYEYNDTLLVTYLASITKGNNHISDLVDKFNVAHERHGRRRGMWG